MRRSLAASIVFPAALVVLSGAAAVASGEKLLHAKLRMQFGTEFELLESDGILYAFQDGVGAKKKKFLMKQPVFFHDYFRDLLEHEGELNSGLRIVILDSKQIYNQGFNTKGLIGHYSPVSRIIYTHKASGAGTLYHELGHHYIHGVFGEEVPVWFNEGLASYFERRVGGAFGCPNWRLVILRKAIKKGKVLPLESILDGKRQEDRFFLAQVRHLFVYLDQLGVLQEFLLGMKERGDFDAEPLLEDLTGMGLEELDADFLVKAKGWHKDVCVGAP